MVQKIKIGILETGANAPALERHGTYANCFKFMLSTASSRFSYHVFQSYLDEVPPADDLCDAYIITGSASSALDPDPWIKSLSVFLNDVAPSAPIVGICFGHQLLHQTFGGKVEKSGKGWGIGVHEYDVVKCLSWMTPHLDRVGMMVSHMDQVVEAAQGTTVLAGSEFCPNGITMIGDNILTMQPHPEHTVAYAQDLYGSRRERIGSTHVDAALRSLHQPIHGGVIGEWIAQFITSRV